MKMISLEFTPEEAKEYMDSYSCSPCGDSDPPKYPPGANFYFSDDMMKKIGMTELPAVGSKMVMMAEVIVTGVSRREDQKETHKSVDLQLTSIALEPKGDTPQTGRMFPSMLGSVDKA